MHKNGCTIHHGYHYHARRKGHGSRSLRLLSFFMHVGYRWCPGLYFYPSRKDENL